MASTTDLEIFGRDEPAAADWTPARACRLAHQRPCTPNLTSNYFAPGIMMLLEVITSV